MRLGSLFCKMKYRNFCLTSCISSRKAHREQLFKLSELGVSAVQIFMGQLELVKELRDISGILEWKTMQKLKDSELRYRRLFESAQDGILILNAETGMIDDVNPFLIQMLGYTREEFIQKKLWELSAFKDVEASRLAFETLQDNEYIRYEDLPLKAKDGRLLQVEFVSNVYQAGSEKVIQCNIRDITERKEAQDALREQAVRDHLTGLFNRRYLEAMLERELLRAAREKLTLGVIMMDVDDFKHFNDAYGHAAGDAILREVGRLLL